jgi:hypothetical protein
MKFGMQPELLLSKKKKKNLPSSFLSWMFVFTPFEVLKIHKNFDLTLNLQQHCC